MTKPDFGRRQASDFLATEWKRELTKMDSHINRGEPTKPSVMNLTRIIFFILGSAGFLIAGFVAFRDQSWGELLFFGPLLGTPFFMALAAVPRSWFSHKTFGSFSFARNESTRSLRFYFSLVGIGSLVYIFFDVESHIKSLGPMTAFGSLLFLGLIIDTLFACAYLYIGIALRDLLVVRPNVVRAVIIANMVFFGFGLLRALLPGPIAIQSAWNNVDILRILIAIYLLANVNRLVREQRG